MYKVELLPKARKDLLHLPEEHRSRISAAIDGLREDPLAGKKLEGKFWGAQSLRVWPYRILYIIYQEIVTVTVVRIDHRKDVYK